MKTQPIATAKTVGAFSALLFSGALPARAQQPAAWPRFSIETSPIAQSGVVRSNSAVFDAGRRAAITGSETGAFDVWLARVLRVRDLHLDFRLAGNDALVPGASVAREVTASPEGVL